MPLAKLRQYEKRNVKTFKATNKLEFFLFQKAHSKRV